MESVRAKEYLGQHFLTDPGATQRIADSVADYLGTSILEVGPGVGVLTQSLLETGHDLQVADIDHESTEYLHQHFPQLSRERRIIEGDFLEPPAGELVPGRTDTSFVVIGSYPYSIFSQIFFRILELRECTPAVASMLQHEVARRLCASLGGRNYGILNVLPQCWYGCNYLFKVSKRGFNPPPKMDGGVMITRQNGHASLPCDETNFKWVVRTAFGQQQKILRNALQSLFGKEFPYANHDIFTLRAERFSVEDFIGFTLTYETLSQENTTTP